jgi:hypothetical protein
MIAKLLSFFAFSGVYDNQRKREEAWLSKSDNLVELERRLKAIQRGDVNIW